MDTNKSNSCVVSLQRVINGKLCVAVSTITRKYPGDKISARAKAEKDFPGWKINDIVLA